jgi:uncharacterized protein DUF3310
VAESHFVSESCQGEICGICIRTNSAQVSATHKVGEEIATDDPNQVRHNLTNYLCCAHFTMVMGRATGCPPTKEQEMVDHPPHYTGHPHPSGVECVQIAELLGFNLGNAAKYLWRAGKKGPEDEDVQKALWYLRRSRQNFRPGDAWLICDHPVFEDLAKRILAAEGDTRLRAMLRYLLHDGFSRTGIAELIKCIERFP